MATNAGTATINVRGDFRPFDRQMSRFAVTSRTRFAKVGRVAGLGFAAGLGAAGFAAKKAFTEFQQAEKATKQTAAVLKSTGGVANVTAKQITDLATAISNKSAIDDEAIQSSENLLLTFTSVRDGVGKGNKIFDRATQAITDMAAAMAGGTGGPPDLKGATIQVGKALQDPIKGITALRRVGVNFDQQQSDRIKRWVEEGKKIKAQKFILAELTREFGGSAAAQATGTARLKVAFDNVAESIGKTFGPTVEAAANSVATFVNQMQQGTGAGGRFAAQISESWGKAITAISKFLDDHRADIEAMRKALETAGRAIAAVWEKLVFPILRRALPAIEQMFTGIARAVAGMINIVSGILTGDWRRVWEGAKQVVSGTVKAIGGQIRLITAPLREVLSKIPGLFRGPFKFAEKLVGDVVAGMLRRFASLFSVASHLPVIGDRFKGIADKVRGLADRIDQTGEKIDKLDGKRVSVDVVMNLINSPSTPRLQSPKDLFNRRREGGMVPAMLSPGEVGITPDGGQFKVPGARVAADTVPAMLPSGTAILTGSGQRMAKQGRSLGEILRKQLPHFRRGGVASPIDVAALAAEKVGFRGQTLLNMLAIAGRESHWNPRAQNLNASTGDHSIGLWQINQLAHHGRFGTDSQLMNPLTNAKAAKSLFGEAGLKPWHSMAGATQFLDQARRAVAATKGMGGGSFSAVTPAAITHPILSTQLRPLIDDALLGGIEAGRTGTGHAGRVDLLQSVLEGIVPDSADRATRQRVSVGGRGGGASGRVAAAKAAARALDRGHFPYVWGGGHVNPARPTGGPPPGFDCSGAVARVMQQAGFNFPTGVSGSYQSYGAAGPGKQLSIYANPTHTFMKIGGSFFGTSRSNDGGGPGWLGDSYSTSGFTVRHPPGFRSGGVAGGDEALLAKIPASKRTKKMLDIFRRTGLLPGLARGGVAGRPKFAKRQRNWMENIWAKAAPNFGKAPDSPLPFARVRFANDIPFVGFTTDPGQTDKSKGELLWPKWLVHGGDRIPAKQRDQLFLHELAHRFQDQAQTPSFALAEGGAEAFGRWGIRNLLHEPTQPSFTYSKFVRQVVKDKGWDWVTKGQFGMRSGGIVGPDFDFDRWLRNLRKEGRKPSLNQLIGLLGADQLGSANADAATRVLARRVQGRSAGSLVGTQNRIKQQIKRMVRHGFTGPERIRTRRLRGALSLVQDELGRPIGRALGRSDRLTELINRRQSTLSDRLTVMGVDPESQQGLQVQSQEAAQGLFRLTQRRGELQKALKRARKSKNPAAVKAVQAEIQDMDDQILGLRASIISLDKTMQQTQADAGAEALQQIADLLTQQNQLQADHNAELVRNRALITAQGPSLLAALTQVVNGTLGGNAGLGRSFPSRPGVGGLASM